MTFIGENAFGNCQSLKQIDIPSSVTFIDEFAFDSCASLSQLKIPDSVKEIGRNTFYGCSSMNQLIIPSSIMPKGSKERIKFNEILASLNLFPDPEITVNLEFLGLSPNVNLISF